MVTTLDENLEPVQVEMRVGQAVETVGQAGRPKTITGFQTHTTPVLLSVGERAQLADQEKWEALTSTLEGIVIIRKKAEEGADGDGDAKMGDGDAKSK